MATIQEIRQQYPQYNDMSDETLADGLYRAHYSDMPRDQFNAKIGLVTGLKDNPDATHGFIDSWQRVKNSKKIAEDVVNEKISPATGAIKYAGQVAAFGLTDPLTAVAEAGIKGFSAAHPTIANAVSHGYENLANSKIGQAVGSAVDTAANKINQLSEEYPNAYGLAEGLTNIASAVPLAKAVAIPAIRNVGKSTIGAAKELVTDPSAIFSKEIRPTTAEMRAEAGAGFEALKAKNLPIEKYQLDTLRSDLQKLTPVGVDEKKIWAKGRAAKHAQEIVESMDEGNYMLNDAIARRQDIVSDIKKSYRMADGLGEKDAAELMSVRDKIDDAIGGKLAPHNLDWQKAKIHQDLDQIVDFSVTKTQPANSFNTQINNYVRKKGRTLPENIKTALIDLGRDEGSEKARKAIASGLIKYALLAKGGPVGFFLGHYASEAAKDSAMIIKLNKLDKIRDMIDAMELPDTQGPWGQIPKKGVKK